MNITGRTVGEEERMELNMTSMIDCVFLLLIFFIMTFEMPDVEGNLPAHLPRKGICKTRIDHPPPPTFQIHIGLSYANNTLKVLLQGADLGGRMDFLESKLYRLRQVERDASVTIDAEPDVPYEYVVRALNTCVAVGYAKVNFAEPRAGT